MRLMPCDQASWAALTRTLLRGTVLVLPFALMANLGCLGNNRQQQELLEADLRSQERHIQEMKDELDRKEGVIHGLDIEVERCQQAAAGAKPPGGDSAPVVNVV